MSSLQRSVGRRSVNEAVGDASAILAPLFDEPGADVVAQYTGRIRILTVTLTEVVAQLAERGIDESDIRVIVARMNLRIEPYDFETALQAGMLRPETRHLGLGLGDRATIAYAILSGLPVLTADHAWERLSLTGLTVIPIR